MLMFAIGCTIGHLAITRPVTIPGAEGSAHHMVMHPLVLGLAEPETPLSRREGLKWDDAAGEAIARRVDPEAAYLSDRYEPALARYYIRLWRRYPGEMAAVYASKLQVAGAGVFEEAARLLEHRGLPPAAADWLSRRSVHGAVLLAAIVALGLLSWRSYCRSGRLLWCAWTMLGVTAVGTLLESALIMPTFQIIYHSPLLLYLLLIPLVLMQSAVDWAAGRMLAGIRTA
jgi:hypothetical protein